jgi:hypothetical protein
LSLENASVDEYFNELRNTNIEFIRTIARILSSGTDSGRVVTGEQNRLVEKLSKLDWLRNLVGVHCTG